MKLTGQSDATSVHFEAQGDAMEHNLSRNTCYFAYLFHTLGERDSRATFYLEFHQNGLTDIVFGLRRHVSNAYSMFSGKKTFRAAFSTHVGVMLHTLGP